MEDKDYCLYLLLRTLNGYEMSRNILKEFGITYEGMQKGEMELSWPKSESYHSLSEIKEMYGKTKESKG